MGAPIMTGKENQGENLGVLLDAKSTQLLNTLTYNYGEIFNSASSSDLSEQNRLAVCTEKCLFLLSFKTDWPPPIKPIKFMSKLRNVDAKDDSQQNIAAPHIDNWIQDLIETRNEAFYVNIVDCVPKSKLVESVFLKYYELEKEARAQRKSFYRSLRDSINASKASNEDDEQDEDEPSRAKRAKKAAKGPSAASASSAELRSALNKLVVEESNEEFLKHQNQYELNKLFDPALFEYLSLINPQNTYNQSQQSSSGQAAPSSAVSQLDGFKSCKWNHNAYSNLLCTISRTNQILIFDCTKLKENDMIASRSTIAAKSKSSNVIEDCTHVLDLKSKSVYFNLTEYWLREHRSSVIDSRATSIDEFVRDLEEFLPSCVEWSRPIKLDSGVHDLLFVAFKSNQLAIFRVTRESSGRLDVQLLDSICLTASIGSLDQTFDESMVPNLFDSDESGKNFVSTMTFHQQSFEINQNAMLGILAIGLSDGRVLASAIKGKLLLNKNDNQPFNFHELYEFSDQMPVERIMLVRLEVELGAKGKASSSLKKSVHESFLAIVQKENRLVFSTFELDSAVDSFKQGGLHYPKQSFSTEFTEKKENSVINNCVRLLDFKLASSRKNASVSLKSDQDAIISFLLSYSNSFMEHLKLSLNLKQTEVKIGSIEVTLVNDSSAINFDLLNNQLNESHSQKSTKKAKKPAVFKSTNNVFSSTNSFLMFQVNDFTKASLILKKPPHFQINVYATKCPRQAIKQFLDEKKTTENEKTPGIERELAGLGDLIWTFKYQLYTNTSFFDRDLFQSVYSHIKNGTNVINTAQAHNFKSVLAYLKHLRYVCLMLADYFESASIFDHLNDANKSGNQDLVSNEDDDEFDDDDDESVETSFGDDENQESPSEPSKPAEKSPNVNAKLDEPLTTQQQSNVDRAKSHDDIIRSHQYYRSMYREFSLLLFTCHAYGLFLHAFEIGVDKLSAPEKRVLALAAEFAAKKNLFKDELLGCLTSKKTAVSKWISSNFMESASSSKTSNKSQPQSLLNDLKCEICTRRINVEQSVELNGMVCEAEHRIGRCEKTLLPLDSINFSKCSYCGSSWNNLDPKEYPNLKDTFSSQLKCIFCD